MKHVFTWLMALALITPQTLTANGSNMTQDQQNVLAAIQNMTQAFQDKNIDRVMASYEDPATVVFEPGTPVSDLNQIEQMFGGMTMVNPVFEYSDGHEVIVNGDVAMHIAPWNMTGRTPEGQSIAQSGLSVAILRRQTDGSWKMVIDNPHGSRLLPQSK